MQSALALGLAKNVNNARQPGARRAASAYNLTGRHMSPSSSSSLSTLASTGEGAAAGPPSVAPDVHDNGPPSLLALSAASSSPMSSSSSCSSISSMINGDLKGLGHGDRDANPVPGSLSGHTRGQELEHNAFVKRGTGVDKTNPFIGYFQMGGRASSTIRAAPASAPPIAAAPSAATIRDGLLGSYQYSTTALFKQQKKITEWIGTQSTRLPSFFARHDEKPPLAATKRGVKKVVQVEELESVETAPVALFADYSIAAAGGQVVEESEDEASDSPARTAIGQLVKDEEQAAGLALRRRASSTSSSVLSTSSTSRFEQDFEVIRTLGEGGQGTVFKVRSKVDGCAYAIKRVVLPPSLERDSAMFHQALREVKAMAGMGTHVNVVRYHTAWLEESVVESRAANVDSQDRSNSNVVDVSAEGGSESSVATSFFSEPSYSISSLSQYDNSMGGVHFESSQSIVGEAESELMRASSRRPLTGVQEDVREDESESSMSESVRPETQLVLYIQMELCGAAAVYSSSDMIDVEQDDSDSFQRLINRITMKAKKKPARVEAEGEVVHSTLSSWLRATVEARANPDENFTKHREGLKLLHGVIEGVQHMHESGVIHRDLKPDNIFIHGNVPKIGDFGLSKSITSDVHDAEARKVSTVPAVAADDHTTALGTFTYASPEQLGYSWNRSKGTASHLVKSAKYSIKSDIFALGIIMLELCYPCATMMERSQVLTAVRHGVVPQIALQRFPDEMALVLRMTSLDPEERPTTQEIAEQLRALLATKESLNVRAALDDLRDVQQKLAMAVLQLRDRSQAAQQLELLVAELSDKVQSVGLAIA